MPMNFSLSSLTIRGREATAGTKLPQAYAVMTGPRYFETAGLALTRGRTLGSATASPAMKVSSSTSGLRKSSSPRAMRSANDQIHNSCLTQRAVAD